MSDKWEDVSFSATIQYGVTVIQGLMAGNGGAVTALFALKDGAQLREYALAALIFGGGFCAAIACAFLSYLAQGHFTGRHEDGHAYRLAAMCAGFASMAALVVGGGLSFSIAMATK